MRQPSADEASIPDWLAEALAEAAAIRTTELPDWIDPASLPPVVVGDRRLDDAQQSALFAALRKSRPGDPHPLVSALREHAEASSRGAFAWALFQQWLAEGAPTKQKWPFLAIGFLGDDDCALKLAPLVRVWPGERLHARAVVGLECLRAIGTDTALLQLAGIAQKIKFKGLKKKAGELMESIARDRGLTRPELEDRIVPDCGLDEDGRRVFDFGRRRFSFVLGPGLKPMALDEAGKLRKDLPKPGVRDDKDAAGEAVAQWKLLKKQLREVLKIQAPRLEQAMITGRRWTVDDFERFFVRHPLMTHLARLVVWGGYDAGGRLAATFRVTEERDFADAADEPFELAVLAEVALVHPLHLGDEDKVAWSEVWSDYELIPPFEQLSRPVFILEPGERKLKKLIRDFQLPSTSLVGTLDRLGWLRGMPQDAGVYWAHSKAFHGAGVTAVIGYEPGVPIGDLGFWEDQKVTGGFFVPGILLPDMYPEDRKGVELGQVDPVVLSEVTADLAVLASKRTN